MCATHKSREKSVQGKMLATERPIVKGQPKIKALATEKQRSVRPPKNLAVADKGSSNSTQAQVTTSR